MDLNNCDKDVILTNNTLPATIGSYASVLKGRNADRMSGKIALFVYKLKNHKKK